LCFVTTLLVLHFQYNLITLSYGALIELCAFFLGRPVKLKAKPYCVVIDTKLILQMQLNGVFLYRRLGRNVQQIQRYGMDSS